ncbi:MAG: 2-oxoglutarate dehydrogenase complex dihydrolipoyllysine-residue succinyltransferase [Planctomycetales bacterium]|nr:2-oxoglutarate dehydrogenase complex dihydrolipoyllysine-residue succinyltransferase [Planctomycetales bacterium]
MLELKVPSVGESITEVQIGQWLKQEGQWVDRDEDVVDLETEKASVQVPAPEAGYIRNIRRKAEEFANVGDTLCEIEPAPAPQDNGSSAKQPDQPAAANSADQASSGHVMPSAERILREANVDPKSVSGTGPGGRVLKEDAMLAVQKPVPRASTSELSDPKPATAVTGALEGGQPHRMEEVKPLSMIRRTIAARLVDAQHSAALLTTFNEINMRPIMSLRKKYRDAFQERHGVKLGFMSFFAKASVEGLRRFPSVNAQIRGNNVVYHHYHDIGIAIGGGKGLVVPVLRNVENMTFADVERTIGDYAAQAMENRLLPENLLGGTFTISNGGVYGSMLSTPIVNPPQSAILGLHAIQDRPMAVNGQVEILPMMYVALTYDHRIIDGREAVSFLKTIKEACEDPTRLFLEV